MPLIQHPVTRLWLLIAISHAAASAASQKHNKLKDLFYALEKRANGILVVFGSYANFTSNKDSDLDVFVIGDIKDTDDLENLYKIKINIIKSSKEKINKEDVFVKEVIKNHIIIKGVEEFVELIW